MAAATEIPSFGHDRFEAQLLLGEGAFGAVYEALDRDSGTRVAVKTLSRFSAERLSRFKREFRTLAEISHPNLVQLHELLEANGEWAIVMDLIEGQTLLEYVKQRRCDEQALRDLFCQLASGLIALHGQRLLHRDIKPSNVMVTSEGRLTVLDFGLVTDLSAPSERLMEQNVGSAAYVSPEQLLGAPVGPPADLYATGVLLYEALTGQLPFMGTPREMALKKELGKLPSIEDRNPDAPEALVRACHELLAADPTKRPTAEQLQRRLSTVEEDGRRWVFTIPSNDAPFTGRIDELEALRAARERASEGMSQQVVVQGESGVGKSALVVEHLRQRTSESRGEWLLRGRCYERETVPYKAFDGLLDDLVQELRNADDAEVDRMLPPDAGLLTKLFPVLAACPALRHATGEAPRDHAEVRQAGYDLLAQLLTNVADTFGLVMVVDDIQWADRESLRLLRSLFDRTDQAGILWLLTCHPDPTLGEPVRDAIRQIKVRANCSTCTLSGLNHDDARDLARRFMPGAASDEDLRLIVDQGQGHPFLLAELASYRSTQGAFSSKELSLKELVASRLRSLEPGARELLELVSVAGVPRPRRPYAVLLKVEEQHLSNLITALRTLRMITVGRKGMVRCFHDRLRDEVARQVPADRLKTYHRRLALALSSDSSCTPTEIGLHWDLAGDAARALPLLDEGANRAFEACAFERSAALRARALELSDSLWDDERRHEAKVARADALGAAGLHTEAAQEYGRLLDHASPRQALELRAQIAGHLIKGARWNEGVEATRELLKELGIPLARSPGAAVAKLLWHRTCLRLTKFNAAPRSSGEIDPHTLFVLDTLQHLVGSVSWLDLYAGGELGARHLRMALKVGEPNHMISALSAEALGRSYHLKDLSPQTEELLGRAEQLARQDARPDSLAVIQTARGQLGQFRWDFRNSVETFEQADRYWNESGPRFGWQVTVNRSLLLNALGCTTEYEKFCECADQWIRSAEARGDLMSKSHFVLMGSAGLRWLAKDEPEIALRELEESQAMWPEEPLGLPHIAGFYSRVLIHGYADPVEAHEMGAPMYARLMKSVIGRPPFIRAGMIYQYMALALAVACLRDGEERAQLLEEIERNAILMGKLHTPSVRLGNLLLGMVAVARGDGDTARPLLVQARKASEASHTPLWTRMSEFALALSEGPQRARDAIAAEERWFAERGWSRPDRCVPWMHPLARLYR